MSHDWFPIKPRCCRAIRDAHSQALLRDVLRLTTGDMPFAEDVVQAVVAAAVAASRGDAATQRGGRAPGCSRSPAIR